MSMLISLFSFAPPPSPAEERGPFWPEIGGDSKLPQERALLPEGPAKGAAAFTSDSPADFVGQTLTWPPSVGAITFAGGVTSRQHWRKVYPHRP